MEPSIIQDLGELEGNRLFIKRDDLLPYSFGGNKARKALLFFEEIDRGGYDCVVTYGSGSSNLCRVVANLCRGRGLPCRIIRPQEASEPSYNSRMTNLFGAAYTSVPVSRVHDTIEETLAALRAEGKKPYFIPGGGHGDLGTEAYVRCYREIKDWETANGIHFDLIFFASGTGTTQAGLICGQLLAGDAREIIGISIARKNPRGRDVVVESVRSYLAGRADEDVIQAATIFLDDYTAGYGKDDRRVDETIRFALDTWGIPLDPTYTGKAFMGMRELLATRHLTGKNILFLHTGGTPLFFDWMEGAEKS